MTDTNSAGWTLGGNPTSALLTGNGAIDPVGNGWLRLTNATGNQTGYAYNNTVFDLSDGLLIEFDYATWGGSGADGYSVYLFDAGVSPFNIGAFGGSLGYSQKGTSFSGGACTSAANVAGISGGYVGFGVDEYGNFADCGEGRYLSLNGNSNVVPNTVTIRGSVVGFGGGAIGQTQNTTSYPWIATSVGAPSPLWYAVATTFPGRRELPQGAYSDHSCAKSGRQCLGRVRLRLPACLYTDDYATGAPRDLNIAAASNGLRGQHRRRHKLP